MIHCSSIFLVRCSLFPCCQFCIRPFKLNIMLSQPICCSFSSVSVLSIQVINPTFLPPQQTVQYIVNFSMSFHPQKFRRLLAVSSVWHSYTILDCSRLSKHPGTSLELKTSSHALFQSLSVTLLLQLEYH